MILGSFTLIESKMLHTKYAVLKLYRPNVVCRSYRIKFGTIFESSIKQLICSLLYNRKRWVWLCSKFTNYLLYKLSFLFTLFSSLHGLKLLVAVKTKNNNNYPRFENYQSSLSVSYCHITFVSIRPTFMWVPEIIAYDSKHKPKNNPRLSCRTFYKPL